LRGRGSDIDAGAEEDFHDADARQRLAFDMIDIVDRRRQLAFVIIDHPAGHVFGRQSAISPDDRDHRHADIGKDIGGRGDPRNRAAENDQYRHDHKGYGL
jgi:hypothetical protein